MEEQKILDIKDSYIELLKYFLNSNLIPRNSNVQEEINMLLIKPIDHLINDCNNLRIEEIREATTAIWYSYNQRCDIRENVSNEKIILPSCLSDKILSFFCKPLNTPINFSVIADISGEIGKPI